MWGLLLTTTTVSMFGWALYRLVMNDGSTPQFGDRSRQQHAEYLRRSPIRETNWWVDDPIYRVPLARASDSPSAIARFPLGRTGLGGKGVFPKHGGNTCAMPVMLRFINEEPHMLLTRGLLPGWRKFEKRHDCAHLVSDVFIDSTYIQRVFEEPLYTLAAGLVDSCLNTDHAWLEADCFLVVLDDSVPVRVAPPLQWVPITLLCRDYLNELDSQGHAGVLGEVARRVMRMVDAGDFEPLEEDECAYVTRDVPYTDESDASQHSYESQHSDTEHSDASSLFSDGDEAGQDVCEGPDELACPCETGGGDAADGGCRQRACAGAEGETEH